MTADQEYSWQDNPNTYVADDEDMTCTARVSGELLLDELCREWGPTAAAAVLECAERALAEADRLRQQSAGGGAGVAAAAAAAQWWKLREAAVNAVGCVAQSMAESESDMFCGGGGGSSAKSKREAAAVTAKLRALLDTLIAQDLQVRALCMCAAVISNYDFMWSPLGLGWGR
jgi:hypothetical protein